MNGWVALAIAIVCEVAGTTAMRAASDGRRVWWLVVAVGYAIAFVLMSVTLAEGVPLGVAYAIWTAAGVALTALLARVIYGESLTGRAVLGLAVMVAGVALIELGTA
ncbi:multidrug efflux SMR transporter [Nocardioides sp. GY 10127]|uniref:DMT family transporter n=1 Tax=Nocardioides sp. GY 10127 TaxID=2569762 RepID=UPI0010A83003|nr:multidrug efflux SMR transporter [Nocardioides sp. GY 10127]TIC82651.1 multidrug efflux SMR transporter [Nocardioides sp. GY 10127]